MKTHRHLSCIILAALGLAAGSRALAANVNLNASDAINTSSFNTSLHWADGQAPSAANDYFTAGFAMRTPNALAANIAFAGNSLTINGGSLGYKGSGSRTITINNLTLDNGSVNVANGNVTMTLAGNGITVNTTGIFGTTTDSSDRTLSVTAPIFGTGTISSTGNGYFLLNSTASTFTGKWLFASRQNRLVSDLVLGPVPASLVPDAITLDKGALMNNSTPVTIAATRGITVTTNGGLIEAGWSLPITINSPITGPGGLTIQNDATPGVITLAGTNTYAGPTLVANSTANWAILLVNGSLDPASTVKVTARGWLGGSGVINGPVWATNSATVSAGDLFKPGTLTINNRLSLTNGLLSFDLASDTTPGAGVNDLIQVNGDLVLQGTNTVNLYALAGRLTAGTYRLINYSGNLIGDVTNLIAAPSRYTVTFDTSTPGQINVTVSGAPADVVWTGATDYNWNINSSSNWLSGANRSVFQQGDRVLFDDSGLYASNITMVGDANAASTLLPGAVTVNSTNTITFNSVGTGGRLGGPMSLYKGGTGTLTLNSGNGNMPNFYDGVTVVTNGILQTAYARALGTTLGGTYATNGGTLDVFGQNLGNEPVTAAGPGFGGNGAIINSGASQQNALGIVTLAGDTTFGGAGRWDIRNAPASLSTGGNGYNLTKTGLNQVSLVSTTVDPALGNIDVRQGIFSMEVNTTSLGDPSKTLTVEYGAAFQLYQITNQLNKQLVFNGGTNLINYSGTNVIVGPLTLAADSALDIRGTSLTLSNGISGPGGLTKISGSPLYLAGTNTYTGNTLINAGALVLGPQATLGTTPTITVATNAALDASAASSFALASGQTLTGSGLIAGNVVAGPGTAVIPGPGIGTLSFSNSLTLNNSSNVFELATQPWTPGSGVNDLIGVGGNLTLNGVTTIKIVPVATLDNSSPYTLFTYGGLLTGGTNNLRVVTDSRYNFTLLDPTYTPYIQVSVSGSGSAASLVWQGGQADNPTAWDLKGTSNWLHGAAADLFYSGDNVTFGDTGATNLVTLAGNVAPASVMMSNNAVNYTLAGAGSLAAGSLAVEGTGTLTVGNEGANTFVGSVTADSGALIFTNGGPNTFNGGLIVNNGTVTLANASANTFGSASVNSGSLIFNQPANITMSSMITDNGSGAGTVVKRGASTLTLSGNNSAYNGAILVSEGILATANGNALGSASGVTTVAAGATLDVNGQNLAGEPVTVIGAGVGGNGAIVNSGAAQINALGSVTLAGDTTFGGTNRWDIRNAPATLSTGSNPYNLTKVGPNQLSLVGATVDAMLANIDIQQGILSVETTTASVGDPTKTLTVRSNASLQFYNLTAALDKVIILNGGGANPDIINYSGANTMVGPVTLNDNCAFNVGGTSLTLNGAVGGTGMLSKIGANTLILAGTNTYTGGTFIGAGTLQLGLNGTTGDLPPQPSGVLTNNGTLSFNRSDDLTFATPIVGAGGVQQIGSDTVTLSASNSFTGQVFINSLTTSAPNGGALRINNAYALGDSTGNTHINGNTTGNGRLELVGNITVAEPLLLDARQTVTIDVPHVLNVSGNNTITGAVVGNTGGSDWNFQVDAGKLTMTGSFVSPSAGGTRRLKLLGAALGEWSGPIANSADNLTPTILVKTNAGTWTLSGTNTYTGVTTIAQGTLALGATGSIGSTPTIDVQSGATFDVSAAVNLTVAPRQTLKGNGTVIGAVIVGTNATLAAGESVGVLTLNNALTFAAGSTNLAEIDKLNTTNDLVTAASLTYGGTLVVSEISGTALAAGDTFKLFNAGSYNGAFVAIAPATPGPGLVWDTSRLTQNGTLRVVAPPQFTSITGLNDGNFRLAISGTVGQNYSVLASTNAVLPITNWTVLTSGTITSTPFTFDDLQATNHPQQFYLISIQ